MGDDSVGDDKPEFTVPEVWMADEDVAELEFDYSDRAPSDFVISGPLNGGPGPGRRFESWMAAERWAREFYGARFKRRIEIPEESYRWGFLVRGKDV
jgi:hypothetical protein